MSLMKSKEFKNLHKMLKLGAQVDQIDAIVSMLTKRKKRLIKRMGIVNGKSGWENDNKKKEN